jgi:GT2 family glycosyltransferase
VTPDVTVVVPSWNTAVATGNCLRSLRDVPDVRVETILVDNASADHTVELVRQGFPEVRVVVHDRNRGFAAACNAGWFRARGRFVLFLNSDVIVPPGALHALLEAGESEPRVGLIGPRLRGRTGEHQPSTRTDPTPGALFHQHTIVRHLRLLRACESRYKMRSFDASTRTDVPVLMGAALLARREALEEVGAFDEGYFMYFEEADLCRRMRARGWRVVFDPSPEMVHAGGASSRVAGAAAEVHYVRSLRRYLRRWSGPVRGRILAALFLPAYLLRRLERLLGDAAGAVIAVARGRTDEADRRSLSFRVGFEILSRRIFDLAGHDRG